MVTLTRDGTAENPSSETKLSGASRAREMSISPVTMTMSKTCNLTQLVYSLL